MIKRLQQEVFPAEKGNAYREKVRQKLARGSIKVSQNLIKSIQSVIAFGVIDEEMPVWSCLDTPKLAFWLGKIMAYMP